MLPQKNLCAVLEDNLASRGDKICLYGPEGPQTFAQIDAHASAIARNLRGLGLSPGARVGLHLANVPEFVATYFGILKADCQVVPLNVMLKPEELAHLGKDSALACAITMPPLAASLIATQSQIPSLQAIYCLEPAPEGCLPYGELLAGDQTSFLARASPGEVAVIFYTSGTTGRPKGAQMSHGALYHNALATAQTYEYSAKDVIVFGMPMFHSSGQTNVMNAAFSQGAAIVMIPRFSPEAVFEAMADYPVSVFIGVPTMYHQILNHPQADRFATGQLRVCIVGAAPMPVELYNAVARKYGVPISEGYGLSEAGPVVAHNPLRGIKKIGSIGLPVPGVQVAIWDELDRPLPVGQVGELVVRGPNLMLGYLNQPEASQEALRNGWLHTGDLARMDEDGYIFVVDRKKDMILTGGFNIYPREVEETLLIHPAVSEAAVIGLPDAEKGEVAAAFVILKPGQTASPQQMIDFCRERMAVYKAPRQVRLVNELPRNPTGKILKRVLREQVSK